MFFHSDITQDLSRAKKYFEDIVSFTIGPYSLDEMIAHRIDTLNIIDVREYEDYIEGHIPYAIHMPYKDIKDNVEMLNKDKVNIIYTYSDSCPRAYNAALALIEKHYPCVVLRGGFKEWKKFDFDIIKTDSDDYKEADEN